MNPRLPDIVDVMGHPPSKAWPRFEPDVARALALLQGLGLLVKAEGGQDPATQPPGFTALVQHDQHLHPTADGHQVTYTSPEALIQAADTALKKLVLSYGRHRWSRLFS